MKQNLGLGKGIGALIPKDLIKQGRSSQQALSDASDTEGIGSVSLIDLDRIISTNPVQPRKDFEEKALNELAQSIAIHGVITPITVRKHFDGFELISGERRLRASKIAGLTQIPAYVMEVSSNAHMLELALIENVQREDLNPLETAMGYHRLIDECGLTQEDVAVRVGKDRSTIANSLRLLKLLPEVQNALRSKKISMGHTRALLALSTDEAQLATLREVIKRDLSVRKTEALVKDIELGRKNVKRSGGISTSRSKPADASEGGGGFSSTIQDIENSLRHVFSTQVKLKMRSEDQGSLEIEFYSLEELERLLDLIANIDTAQ
jgi:ParB family transcriptional regulator, chromosome partitioning protein